MELSKFILILAVLFMSFHGNSLRDIPSPSSKRDIPTENPQRNLEETGNNYIVIYFNQNCEYPNGFQNGYRSSVSYIKHMYYDSNLKATDEMTIYGNSPIEIHFNFRIETLEHFFDATYDKNMEYAESIDLTHFDSSYFFGMDYMFAGCKSLKSIQFGDFSTDQVRSMNSVFLNCVSLISLNLSSFRTEKVKDATSMFQNCRALDSLDISNFNLENVEKDSYMVDGLYNLHFINLLNFKDRFTALSLMEQRLSYLDNYRTLYICRYSQYHAIDTYIYCCNYSIETKICRDDKNYITIYYDRMLTYNYGFQNEFRGEINYIYSEFYARTRGKGMLMIYSHMKVEIHYLFPLNSLENYFCPEQKKIIKTITENRFVNQYRRKGKKYVFDPYTKYLISVDFSHFDSSQVTSIVSLFEGCTLLRSVNFGNFDASKIQRMDLAFYDCHTLNVLDLSMFDTSHVNSFSLTFENCNNLESVDLSNLDITGVVDNVFNRLFTTCSNLKYLNIKNIRYRHQSHFETLLYGLGERDLIVCQNIELVKGTKIKNLCCNYNVRKKICETSNYISIYYNKNV